MAKTMRSGLAVLVAVVSLASCGAANKLSHDISSQAEAPMESTAVADSANILTAQESGAEAVEADASSPVEPPADVAAGQPQLIKQAQLSLVVESIDDSLKSASQVIRTHQGDILDLQDNQIEAIERTAYIRIRVPQANLDALLEALGALGTVQQQGLSAEDVSAQIVDAQARLRNLRKSEESLLKIMERSGEISHVLEVSRELSRVREQIEQIDARVQNLKTQVRYSTVELTLAAAVASQPVGRPLGETIGATWREATQSVGDLTVGLMQIGLWLLAYSPYLLVVAVASIVGYRTIRRRPSA
ncbi:DUF4349 domain-containing protein [Leptolyngbya cf. ectocarpi LEGE 11479]|uniref:DUF4349 domain-containing protein n=1 Tax=Leptolyngbya cf. ectocarpi LEGE 11479 TaxID=1828722 RepID=A0A929F7L9_LEPEC|nr:DUF4349 domain-containing protein [Leptolyngbya ectocarpi]MBE9068810.1 DUF4349 domain-containing protein [Leptolyngbya cf. ectocarpi LEGE 11479]